MDTVAGVCREGVAGGGEGGCVGHGRVDERLGPRVAEVALHLGSHLNGWGR